MIELAAPEDPAVSVIVLLDGAVELAERCLRALAACDQSVPFETLALLNDPDSGLEGFVRDSTSGVRAVLSRANAGPGVGWNLAATVARAPRLATLHEDSEPDPGWLVPLVEAMSEHGAGAVGPRLYNHDGSVQNCGWALFSDASVQPITAASAPDAVAATEPTPADLLSGAAMLVDREAVGAIGGWDERFHPAVYADIDVSTAMWNLGKPVLSVPASSVRHASGTFDRRPNSPLTGAGLRTLLVERNSGPFREKWGSFVEEAAAPPDLAEPESVRRAVAASLARVRERSRQIRSGEWRSPRPDVDADLRFSTLAEPPLIDAGDAGFRVAPEVEQALDAAEAQLVRDYCLWLVRKEKRQFDRLLGAGEELTQAGQSYRELDRNHRALLEERDELAGRLNRSLPARIRRLRAAVTRRLGR